MRWGGGGGGAPLDLLLIAAEAAVHVAKLASSRHSVSWGAAWKIASQKQRGAWDKELQSSLSLSLTIYPTAPQIPGSLE